MEAHMKHYKMNANEQMYYEKEEKRNKNKV